MSWPDRSFTESRYKAQWQPLLTGAAKHEVEEIIAEIENSVSGVQNSITDVSLAGGLSGILLFTAYGARYFAEARRIEKVDALADRIIHIFANTSPSPPLYGGFIGVAWSLLHVQKLLPNCELARSDLTEDVDEAALAALDQWDSHYDLISGLAGFAVFAFGHPNKKIQREVFHKIHLALDRWASAEPIGKTWITPSRLLFHERDRERFPLGNRNLGVAHGASGAIAALALGVLSESLPNEALGLLENSTAWILAQTQPSEIDSVFGYVAERREKSRCAWCYGDLGMAAALAISSLALRDAKLFFFARQLALGAARRTQDTDGVVDAGICHGAAGNAHIYNRLFQTFDNSEFRVAAVREYHRIRAMRSENTGFAGFRFPDTNGEPRKSAGFLTGAAGIGLALLAMIQSFSPAWDQVLLISGDEPSPG
jgi:lantibiotic modifying enzyme